jgi:hypothetical protein
MIQRFRKVTDGLYRGSAPSPQDVAWMKENLGINKIVSLDEKSGDRIDRACKLLGINHMMVPIELHRLRTDLLKFIKHDIKELLLESGPTFVHCAEGKDRTGLAVALLQVKYLGKKPEAALEEAKSLGFGLNADPKAIHLFEKMIHSSKPAKNDTNSADIVSNEREYIGDNRDSFLDEGHQGSFAPYLSETKQNPMDAVYNYVVDQAPTRENYRQEHDEPITKHDNQEEQDVVPMVGVYDNDAGGRGFGPTDNNGGFIYD